MNLNPDYDDSWRRFILDSLQIDPTEDPVDLVVNWFFHFKIQSHFLQDSVQSLPGRKDLDRRQLHFLHFKYIQLNLTILSLPKVETQNQLLTNLEFSCVFFSFSTYPFCQINSLGGLINHRVSWRLTNWERHSKSLIVVFHPDRQLSCCSEATYAIGLLI